MWAGFQHHCLAGVLLPPQAHCCIHWNGARGSRHTPVSRLPETSQSWLRLPNPSARISWGLTGKPFMQGTEQQSCHFKKLTEQAPRPGSASSLVNICRCDSSLRFAFIVTTCLIQSGFTEQTHLPLSLCGDPQPQILTRAWVLWTANLSQVGHNINNLKHVCFFFFLSLFWPHSLWDLSYLTRLNPGPRQWKRRVLTLTCVLSCFSHVWLFATPRTVALQAPLSMGLSRQEYWSGLPLPSPRDLPYPGIELTSLTSPALVGRFFTTSTTWEAP